MGLSREEVEKVALLGRLRLSDEELDRMTLQLRQIVEYVQLLETLKTDDVQPMAHAADLQNAFAADKVRPSLDREQALANAPKRDDECYRVPAVLSD